MAVNWEVVGGCTLEVASAPVPPLHRLPPALLSHHGRPCAGGYACLPYLSSHCRNERVAGSCTVIQEEQQEGSRASNHEERHRSILLSEPNQC